VRRMDWEAARVALKSLSPVSVAGGDGVVAALIVPACVIIAARKFCTIEAPKVELNKYIACRAALCVILRTIRVRKIGEHMARHGCLRGEYERAVGVRTRKASPRLCCCVLVGHRVRYDQISKRKSPRALG
jgi:hypothetical protein